MSSLATSSRGRFTVLGARSYLRSDGIEERPSMAAGFSDWKSISEVADFWQSTKHVASLFQGYHFAKPALMTLPDVPIMTRSVI